MKRLVYFLKNIDAFIAGVSLVLVIFLTTYSVFMRYVVNKPVTWLEEIQILLFIWISFFGASVAFRTNSHIVIEIMVDLFPTKVQNIVEMVNSLIVSAILSYMTYLEIARGFALVRSGRATSILNIPIAVNYFGVAASLLFMLANFAHDKYAFFDAWAKGRKQKGAQ